LVVVTAFKLVAPDCKALVLASLWVIGPKPDPRIRWFTLFA